ncbi:UDP-glucose--hexose-1-phosphate uridylyltransferase [Paenibacillus thermotolerans]|uniref:UDP-glucose--hexose-1-phosphate uridylyltransferase n=1 Tax=Paenibacillus thermotolerans TaxID=3027807 RepID=UPI002368CC4B|nr:MULTISPECIES: UDP-glucose--hexose-1-phosphate uridylyltransferase [unclassified Paenibacillus]
MGDCNAAYEVERLLQYALKKDLIEPIDIIPSRNALLDILRLPEPYEGEPPDSLETPELPAGILERLLDYALEAGILEENTGTHRELFDTRLMGCLMPRASEVVRRFGQTAANAGIVQATDDFYRLAIDSGYIRMDRIRNNLYWRTETEYGELEITVNLSKPEKDPREIALLRNAPAASYPKCLLCADNVGYAGRLNHPARQNLRVIPLQLDGEDWFLQYSPYVYYNEHSIVFHGKHVPMKISGQTFVRLLDFLDRFPHYFIGSNADLPIVGGSILNHDHFQGGRHVFPEEKAPVERSFTHPDFPDVRAGIVKWPMSIVRIASWDREQALRLAVMLLARWRAYSDPSVDVHAFTGETPHNTITPIARMTADGEYELDLVLRNNLTSEEHPEGIYHPHRYLHHIKKENIGLIEVMGLAVLPGRLKEEMSGLAEVLTGARKLEDVVSDDSGPLYKHAAWIEAIAAQHGTSMRAEEAEALLRDEVGRKFMEVLTCAGVFKRDEAGQRAFDRFLFSAGFANE